MIKHHSHFDSRSWPYVFLLLQISLIFIFILWPAGKAIIQSFFRSDAFGIHNHFIWLQNFIQIFSDYTYLNSLVITIIFSIFVTLFALAFGLLMAVLANRLLYTKGICNTLLIWPYAVAPVISGVLWSFLFNPAVGVISYALDKFGYQWNYFIHGHQALALVLFSS